MKQCWNDDYSGRQRQCEEVMKVKQVAQGGKDPAAVLVALVVA